MRVRVSRPGRVRIAVLLSAPAVFSAAALLATPAQPVAGAACPPPATPASGAPGAPQNVSATAQPSGVTVSWTSVAGATGYLLSATPRDGSAATCATAAATATSASITGLSSQKSYDVQVAAQSGSGTGPAAPAAGNPITPLPGGGGGGSGGTTPSASGAASASASAPASAAPSTTASAEPTATATAAPTAAPTFKPVPTPAPAQSPPGDPKNYDLGPIPLPCSDPSMARLGGVPSGESGALSPYCIIHRDPYVSMAIGGHFFQVGDTIVAAVTGSPPQGHVDHWNWDLWPGTKRVSGCHADESECIMRAVAPTGPPGQRYILAALNGDDIVPWGGCCGGNWIATDYYAIIDLTGKLAPAQLPQIAQGGSDNPFTGGNPALLIGAGGTGLVGGGFGGVLAIASARRSKGNGNALRQSMQAFRRKDPYAPWSDYFASTGLADPNTTVQPDTAGLFLNSLSKTLTTSDGAQRMLFLLVGYGNSLLNFAQSSFDSTMGNTLALVPGTYEYDQRIQAIQASLTYLLSTPVDQMQQDLMGRMDQTITGGLQQLQQGLQSFMDAVSSGDNNRASQIIGQLAGDASIQAALASMGQAGAAGEVADAAAAGTTVDAAASGTAAKATSLIPPGAPEPVPPLGDMTPSGVANIPPGVPSLTDAQLAAVSQNAVPIQSGVTFLPPTDASQLALAQAITPAADGAFTVAVHGTPNAVMVGDTYVNAADMATLIRQSGWNGQPIRLISCYTGSDAAGFAQALANELGVPVQAPSAVAFTPAGQAPYVNSTTYVQTPNGPVKVLGLPGSFFTFTPAGGR